MTRRNDTGGFCEFASSYRVGKYLYKNIVKGRQPRKMSEIQLLKVSNDKRFIVKEDGTPFFWLGDTAWELFHALTREEADRYLENRAQLKFTVIQAVALAELDGIREGNAYGRKPLLQNSWGEYDPIMPDERINETDKYTYWDHIDYIIDKAASLGLYIALLPTWGDKYHICWGKGPEIFNEENARIYGKWLAKRYQDRKNIVWVLGGDRQLITAKHFAIINEMAKGIRDGETQKHLMTLHPAGTFSSSYHVHEEEWLDFNMIQSGHDFQNNENYKKVTEDYNRKPVKPVIDAEPRYEDHPIKFNPVNGYFDDFDVRQAAYWALFAGACGHTYGHHSIWCMCKAPTDYFIMTWQAALNRPGACQMQYARALMESRQFTDLIPDQELVAGNYEGANHIKATRGKDYAFLYSPNGLKLQVNMGRISGENIKAYWYNPRNGEAKYIGEEANKGVATFTPPTSGRNNDWILVLDDSRVNYAIPGMVN